MSNELKFAICVMVLLLLILIFNKTTERMHEFGRALTNLDDSFLAQLKNTDPSIERLAPEFADVLENQYAAEQSISFKAEHMNSRCPVDIDPLETKFLNKMGIVANHIPCA